MDIQFINHNNVDSEWFYQTMKIYIDSFPSNERHPIDTIKHRIKSEKSELYIGILNQKVICFALLWEFKNLDFILLDYFAVDIKYRRNQIGTQLFNFLKDIVKQRNKHLIIEAEHPNYGENQSERAKRINFYLNNGAFILKDVQYILPSLDGTIPTKMILMAISVNEGFCFEKEQISKLLTHLYVDVYGKNERNETLIKLIERLPNQINPTNESF